MPKGITSRPTNRATKKIMKRTANKSVKSLSTQGALFGQNLAAGRGGPTLAEEQRKARKTGAAYDRFVSRNIMRGRGFRRKK